MLVRILHRPGCAHGKKLAHLCEETGLARQGEIQVIEVASEAEAGQLGMFGSPTIYVDDLNLFPPKDASGFNACRVFMDERGEFTGLPSEEVLRNAFERALSGEP